MFGGVGLGRGVHQCELLVFSDATRAYASSFVFHVSPICFHGPQGVLRGSCTTAKESGQRHAGVRAGEMNGLNTRGGRQQLLYRHSAQRNASSHHTPHS